MATITRPLPGAPVEAERPRISSYLRWSVDHKVIGIQYMVMAFIFFLIGGSLAMVFRTELLTPQLDVVQTGQQYNQLFSIHGTVMIFLWVIPFFAGLGNYLVPLMLGAKDMAFPWLNAFAFWLIPPAGIFLLATSRRATAGRDLRPLRVKSSES